MISNNQRAFLSLLAWSEGTTRIAGNDDGYNVLVGGTLFHSYADHPRILVKLNDHLSSTAAGRYQILAKYYDAYKKTLNLPDFSPESQDAIALQMIKEQHAISDIDAGNIPSAIAKCANIWASLPGANYGQRENKLKDLLSVYSASLEVLA